MKSTFYKSMAGLISMFAVHAASAQLNPLVIGTIAPGDSIVVYYDVTINTPCGCTQVSNQGVITGSNFTTINTNDPDSGPADDATITLLNMFPLPVSLYEFSGIRAGNGIRLSWKTTQESDMIRYEVERSINGIDFIKIGEVASVNSSTAYTYGITDASPSAGMNYYRLRMIEQIGQPKYSTIVKVDYAGLYHAVQLYPNPVSHRQITLQLSNVEKGNYRLVFYAVNGQMAHTIVLNHNGGSASRTITIPSVLSAGMYNVQLQNEKTLHQQFILVK